MSPAMTHRLQILLDEDRYQRVAAEAERKRLSIAAVIRDAIDAALEDATLAEQKWEAWERLQELSADTSMYPPGWDAMDDIREAREERARDLP